MRSIPRFFGRVLPQANRIHLRMLLALQHRHSRLSQGPFLPLIRTRSGSLDFSSRVTSRDRHQNNNRGAQGIVVGIDPLNLLVVMVPVPAFGGDVANGFANFH